VKFARCSTGYESASRKRGDAWESPRVASPTWRGRKGWSCPLRSDSRCAPSPIASRHFASIARRVRVLGWLTFRV